MRLTQQAKATTYLQAMRIVEEASKLKLITTAAKAAREDRRCILLPE